MSRLLALLFVGAGLSLLVVTVFPILLSDLSFRLLAPPRLFDPSLLPQLPQVIRRPDYTQASVWFSSPISLPPPAVSSASAFTLSLPRLGLTRVPVTVNGSDLKQSAIHYPGTALPGQLGNTVIFGHSSLPVLYKPGSSLTIFNPLVRAKVGDLVEISFDGVAYRYQVIQIQEVSPRQIEVLSQPADKYHLTLVTCVPLGTYWRRLVLTAELVN